MLFTLNNVDTEQMTILAIFLHVGVMALTLLPDGNLASGISSGGYKIWNPYNGSLLFTLTKSGDN